MGGPQLPKLMTYLAAQLQTFTTQGELLLRVGSGRPGLLWSYAP